MFVDDGFDFTGIDIFAACDDHVFQAVEDVEKAIVILIAYVSGAEHSVSKRESGFLRIVPIAAHDVGAPCDQFAVLPDFHFFSRLVFDTQGDPRTRSATRQKSGSSMLAIFETCEEPSLTESVALEKFGVRQKLSGATDKFRRHRRTAISQNLEAGQVIRLRLRHLRQKVQHRRHEHGVSHAFALNHLTEILRTELRKCDLAGAESRRCEHGGKIGNMENGCRMQKDPALPITHPVAEVIDVRLKVGVSDHDALWPARRAARIDERKNSFGVIQRIWTRAVPTVQALLIEDELPRKLNRRLRERGMPHQPARFCIKENLIDFSCGEPRVYGNCSNTEPTAGVDQINILR